MRVGVVKEIKVDENRVALTPAGARTLVKNDHEVWVQTGAGQGSGFDDENYRQAGATMVQDPAEIWGQAHLVVKVKEPVPSEFRFFRADLTLFTYLHLANDANLTRALIDSGMVAIGYETVQRADGRLPLLEPMSEVAGRMAAQVGAQFLERPHGGAGILLGGVPGVLPAMVTVIGGGIVGTNAARIALGLGAEVTVIDLNAYRLRELDEAFQGRLRTLMSSEAHIAEMVERSDLLVGAVLVPGARAPHLVTEHMVQTMRPGSVIVDVAVDQGGSVATVDHATTHSDPVYVKFGIVHYAVANMPGAVPRTSTFALTNVTFPYIHQLARLGVDAALRQDAAFGLGLNVYHHHVTHPAVAQTHQLPYTPSADLLGA